MNQKQPDDANTPPAEKPAATVQPEFDLEPLPYHVAIRDYLKSEEKALWDWFSKTRTHDEHAEAIKFDLLKKTYRLDRESEGEFYEFVEEIAGRLAIDVPITLYHAQSPDGINAAICEMVHEAHIVLYGPIRNRLTNEELAATFAHELGHLILWRNWDKEFLISELTLAALTKDPRAQPAHFETARLFRLHTEIFCDRCGLVGIADPLISIASLVKSVTDTDQVNPESYLQQAREICEKGRLGSDGITHPETFIRALALDGWAQATDDEARQETDKEIREMIRGELSLDMDLLGQQQMSELTRRLIDVLLAPKWMQTDLTLAHAKSFFGTYAPPGSDHVDAELTNELKFQDEDLQKYVVYLILDFVAADRDLEHAPIALGMQLTEAIGLKDLFVDLARKELRLRKKQLTEIDKQRDEILAAAAEKDSRPETTEA